VCGFRVFSVFWWVWGACWVCCCFCEVFLRFWVVFFFFVLFGGLVCFPCVGWSGCFFSGGLFCERKGGVFVGLGRGCVFFLGGGGVDGGCL